MNKITKKQHIVPKFYLKRFANSAGFLQVLDIRNKQMGRLRPYASACYDDFFYAKETGKQDRISQIFELAFKRLESEISSKLDSICDNIKNGKQITEEERHILANFMSMLWLRSKGMRESINKMNEQFIKEFEKMRLTFNEKKFDKKLEEISKKSRKKITRKEKDEIKNVILKGNYKLKFNNSQHLLFITNFEGFSNIFFNKNWKIYISKGNWKFITSDTPVIEWTPKRKGAFGPTILDRKHYLPLSPDILIELLSPVETTKKIRRKTLYKDKDDEILMFNILIADHSYKYAYAESKNEFLEMLRQLKSPGRATLLHFEKFRGPS